MARGSAWRVALAIAVAPAVAHADLAGYYGLDAADFQRMTGATVATQPYPVTGTLPGSFTSGSVTFSPAPGSSLFLADWSSAVPIGGGGASIALNGAESFDIQLAAPVHALAFEFDNPGNTWENASYSVRFYLGANLVGSEEGLRLRQFSLNGTEPWLLYGWWSDQLFDRVEIRETSTANENEYFGRVYTSARPPPPKLLPSGGSSDRFSAAIENELLAISRATGSIDLLRLGAPNQAPELVRRFTIGATHLESGSALAIQGGRLAIGNANLTLLAAGAVVVAEPGPTGDYSLLSTATAPSPLFLRFGDAIDLDGDFLAVGAPATASSDGLVANLGHVFVFEQSGGNWLQRASIPVPDATRLRLFGRSVAIQGDELFVASHSSSPPAEIHRYQRIGDQWLAAGTLAVENGFASSYVDGQVSVEGDLLAVSAPFYIGDKGATGAVTIHRRLAGGWQQEAVLLEGPNVEARLIRAAVHGGDILVGIDSSYIFTRMDGVKCVVEFRRDPQTLVWQPGSDRSHPLALGSDQCGVGVALGPRYAVGLLPRDHLGSELVAEGIGPQGTGSISLTARGLFWNGFDR